MQQLTLPGIDFVPCQVRRYGLREFHHYPLASYGKNAAGIWLGSRRVPPELAWTYPELELGRTANSIPALIFDIDRPDWGLEIFDGVVPLPNWATWRRTNQHAHLVYALARPVLRGEQARPTPQGWLARAGEYLAAMNAEFVLPLGERDLGGIVKSIRRIQTKNLQSGQTQRTFSFLQAARGRKSGQARRTKNADRDAAIVAAYAQGQSHKVIAERYGLTKRAVGYILRRQRDNL